MRETVIGIVLCYSHHVTFFTICPKLPVTMVTMAFTFTFPDVFIFVVSGLKKNIGDRRIWRKKGTDRTDLHNPIHSPPLRKHGYPSGTRGNASEPHERNKKETR